MNENPRETNVPKKIKNYRTSEPLLPFLPRSRLTQCKDEFIGSYLGGTPSRRLQEEQTELLEEIANEIDSLLKPEGNEDTEAIFGEDETMKNERLYFRPPSSNQKTRILGSQSRESRRVSPFTR